MFTIFFPRSYFFMTTTKQMWREDGGKEWNKMRSNTHDVILSSLICVFCADAWSLQWFHFFFKWVSVLLLVPLPHACRSFFPSVCRCVCRPYVCQIRCTCECVCLCTEFAGHLFSASHPRHPINCVHVWKNIPFYINIF